MRKFRFVLAAVLEARERDEQAKLRELASAAAAYHVAEAKLQQLHAALDVRVTRFAGVSSAALIAHLGTAIAAQERVARAGATAWERARTAACDARRQRELLSRLRARHFGRYRAREAALEQRRLDEWLCAR